MSRGSPWPAEHNPEQSFGRPTIECATVSHIAPLACPQRANEVNRAFDQDKHGFSSAKSSRCALNSEFMSRI